VAKDSHATPDEERFRRAAEAVNGIIYEFDPRSGHVERTRGLFEVCGFHPSEVPPTADWWYERIHPDDKFMFDTRCAARRSERVTIRYRVLHRDGRWIHVEDRSVIERDEAGHPIRVTGCTIDISGRRKAEEDLQARTAQLDFALASTGVGMWLNSMPLGQLNWDARTRELFFVPPGAEPSIELFYSRLHPDDREPTRLAVEQALRDRTVYAIDHRVVNPDTGEVRWVRSSGIATYDESGNPVRFDGINYDITERKEEDRRKDEFLAMLAHELRNPLAALSNAAQILKAKGPPDPTLVWARDVIVRQLNGMARLLDDLLDVSRISRNKLELRKQRVELAAVIESAVEIAAPAIEAAGHTFVVTVPPAPVIVEADPVRLAQVFSNLLNNAAKFTRPGGRIKLTVEEQGETVVATVTDNGVGIAPDALLLVFQIFAQGSRAFDVSQGGLGVGLSLVKDLVRLHGGTIEAHSEGLDRGSTFTLRLPVAPPVARDEPSDARMTPGTTHPKRRRILVVDDSRDSADSLDSLLRLMGQETRVAYDGVQAVTAAGEFRPDVVLLDLGMPNMNGYDACRRIREQPWGRTMRIFALTGWGQDEDRRRTAEAGFDDHLVKPVEVSALQTLIEAPSA
jgi:PAS domain S-box-containing protein